MHSLMSHYFIFVLRTKLLFLLFLYYRCEISEVTESKDKFSTHLANELPILIRHDFLAKSQASYFSKIKIGVNGGEFVICMDFAENYTFHVQNMIQAHDWANTQATRHPYVIYYCQNGEEEQV